MEECHYNRLHPFYIKNGGFDFQDNDTFLGFNVYNLEMQKRKSSYSKKTEQLKAKQKPNPLTEKTLQNTNDFSDLMA